MTFLGGFVVGGANGYLLAKQAYESANKGRKYLSPSEAFVSPTSISRSLQLWSFVEETNGLRNRSIRNGWILYGMEVCSHLWVYRVSIHSYPPTYRNPLSPVSSPLTQPLIVASSHGHTSLHTQVRWLFSCTQVNSSLCSIFICFSCSGRSLRIPSWTNRSSSGDGAGSDEWTDSVCGEWRERGEMEGEGSDCRCVDCMH